MKARQPIRPAEQPEDAFPVRDRRGMRNTVCFRSKLFYQPPASTDTKKEAQDTTRHGVESDFANDHD
jgi:hypothetical protein